MLRDAAVLLRKWMQVPVASNQEKENARIKKLVAEQALDMGILKVATRPNL